MFYNTIMVYNIFQLKFNWGPPADLLINQGVRDNVSGHTTRAPPGRVTLVCYLCVIRTDRTEMGNSQKI